MLAGPDTQVVVALHQREVAVVRSNSTDDTNKKAYADEHDSPYTSLCWDLKHVDQRNRQYDNQNIRDRRDNATYEDAYALIEAPCSRNRRVCPHCLNRCALKHGGKVDGDKSNGVKQEKVAGNGTVNGHGDVVKNTGAAKADDTKSNPIKVEG